MGHVFRSFYLMKRLKKKYDFIIFTKKQNACEFFFKKKRYKIVTYSKYNEYKMFKKTFKKFKIDKFVNDYISINKKILSFLIKLNLICYFLDTKGVKASEKINCINTFIDNGQKHKNYRIGLKYIIKDPSLKISKSRKLIKKTKILLHFGGTDEKKLNIKIASFLSSLKKIECLYIILGPALNYKIKELDNVLKKINFKFKKFNYPKSLNKIYNSANVAIISGGNTLFNFCSLGKRNISISTNKFEIGSCKKMKKLNLTNYFGHYDEINQKNFLAFFTKVLNKNTFNKKKLKINGVEEIAKIIN